MGYQGYLDRKLIAQELRKRGMSYSEIQQEIFVPKSTLSGWCRDIILSEEQAVRLMGKKLVGSALGRMRGAKRLQAKRLLQTKQMFDEGVRDVGLLSKRDRFIAGVCLYAAEGAKRDRVCAFSNSDPNLIKFMARWYREFCKVPEKKFRGSIWIHEGLNIYEARRFWAELAGISTHQFHKTYIARNISGSRKIRKNIHQYGVFSLKFADAKVHRRVMGWIAGISGNSKV